MKKEKTNTLYTKNIYKKQFTTIHIFPPLRYKNIADDCSQINFSEISLFLFLIRYLFYIWPSFYGNVTEKKVPSNLASVTFLYYFYYQFTNVRTRRSRSSREKVARLNDLIDTGLTIGDPGRFVIDGDR